MKQAGSVRIGWCALLTCVALLAGNLRAGDDQQPSLRDLEKQFRGAARDGSLSDARRLADQIAAIGGDDAIDILVEHGLTQDNYALEVQVGGRLLEMQGAENLAHLCKLTNKHKDYRVRLVLTLVMAKRPEPEAFEAVLRNLYDRFIQVVLTAIEAVQNKDDMRAVDSLIEGLAYQEVQPGGGNRLLVFELRKTLTQLTGTDLELAADWKNFWEPRRGNFERPSEKDRGESLTGVRGKGPSFFNIEVNDSKVLFLLDISGSMKKKDPLPEEAGDREGAGPLTGVVDKTKKKKPEEDEIPDSRMRLARVQAELVRVLTELPSDTRFNIITFNHEIGHFQNQLVQANQRNKDLAIRFVRNFVPMGETHTDDALRAAFAVNDATTIFLLSDGAPRRNDTLLDVSPILNEVREENRFRRVRLHTIGFEQAGSNLRKFMSALAHQNQGKFTELK